MKEVIPADRRLLLMKFCEILISTRLSWYATGEDLSPHTLIPTMYKIIAIVMLQNGLKPGFGLGRNSHGIVEPIPVPVKGTRYGLGCIRTDNDMKMKKNSDQASVKSIPYLYQSFLVWEYAEHDDLGKGICGLLKEIDVVIEEEVEIAGIHDVAPGDML